MNTDGLSPIQESIHETTASASDTLMEPGFIGPPGQQLFTLDFKPAGVVRGHIIYIPPFGEEMNRSRTLAAEQARRFARNGYHCTVLDLFGTGDSDGELVDATISTWLENIEGAAANSETEGLPKILWGLRLGALLAMHAAAANPGRFQRLVLWQPVTSGKRFMTQLLRLRVASLASRGLPAESTQDIRRNLDNGETVDVAGYPLVDALVSDIEKMDAGSVQGLDSIKLDWFEYLPEEGAKPAIGVQKALDALREQCETVRLHSFSSPPVWQLQKRYFSHELVAKTTGLLQ
ncbi:hydrolase 2, exosortase A system-associated [Pseudomaricurvus alkylphenolicus]|uniref:hydrolase 2, exosortase A system-associated n=1 Tax=Pseudomaricurvus alkylphenolicus TaxID=1306991 RepID=UPI001421BA88|nr:hydrolase 2, exosortase A system-associated [Pseudomaricurvus alkylphenolicus]NIB43095.1 hydrolase 2, exosortase A system-associated [Pseudomaricurvus alkylphenolicus]